MIEPQKLAAAINSKTPSGQSAFTPQQIADLAAKENSPFQKRLKRAMDLGVTKEQALKFYAFGTAGGPQEKEPPKTGFFDQISQQFQSVAQNVQGRRVAFGQDIENFQNRQHGVASTLEGVSQLALRFPGRAAQAAGDMIGGLAAPLVQNAPEIASTALQGVGIPNEVTQQRFNEAGRVLSGVIQSEPVQAVAKFYQGLDSDTRADVESMAALGLASLDIAPGINATPKVLKEVGEGSLSGARGIAKAVFRPKTVEQLLPQLDAAIGQIIQGDKESLKAARSAFQIVDTQGVRTYEDLNQTLRENVKALATKQNAILDAVQDVHTLDSFARTSKVGSQTATTNHVANALNHLEELYLKTGNMDDYVRIKAMKESAATEGLTARQVNNIAREYGVEMPKGFNPKTGDPLTSINSQLTENTRMGVKEAARSILPDDTSRLLDEQMSSLFDTLRNTERVENGVLKLAQKVMKRGILEKVGRLLGRTIDVATGHGLRGFAQSIFPSNVGLKQMNFLQIQDALVSNLGKVEDLIKRIDTMEPDKAAKEVYQLIKESSPKGPIPFSHRSIESESRTLQLRGGQKGRPGIDKPAPLPQPQAQTSVNGGSVGGVNTTMPKGKQIDIPYEIESRQRLVRLYRDEFMKQPDFYDLQGLEKKIAQFEDEIKQLRSMESPKVLPRDGATAGMGGSDSVGGGVDVSGLAPSLDSPTFRKGFVVGDTVTMPTGTFKVGDTIDLGMAGAPPKFPKPWKLKSAINEPSSVDGANHVTMKIEAANGKIMDFKNTEIYSPLSPSPLPKSLGGSDTLEPLMKEARKYKSAEEFADEFVNAERANVYADAQPLARTTPIDNFGTPGDDGIALYRAEQATNDAGVQEWVKKIKAGERPPIITGSRGFGSPRVLDGHHRLAAYRQLGFKEVPTISHNSLTDLWKKANNANQ